MAYVVTDPCIKCKLMDCVEVCPVDCFYEGENMLVINPDECIDCGVCIPECPVNAILPEEDVPQDQMKFIPINAELAKKWPSITKRKAPLPDADHATRERIFRDHHRQAGFFHQQTVEITQQCATTG